MAANATLDHIGQFRLVADGQLVANHHQVALGKRCAATCDGDVHVPDVREDQRRAAGGKFHFDLPDGIFLRHEVVVRQRHRLHQRVAAAALDEVRTFGRVSDGQLVTGRYLVAVGKWCVAACDADGHMVDLRNAQCSADGGRRCNAEVQLHIVAHKGDAGIACATHLGLVVGSALQTVERYPQRRARSLRNVQFAPILIHFEIVAIAVVTPEELDDDGHVRGIGVASVGDGGGNHGRRLLQHVVGIGALERQRLCMNQALSRVVDVERRTIGLSKRQ